MDLNSDDLPTEDGSDLNYGSNSRAPKSTDTDKTLAVLGFMKDNFPRFSLRDFLTELFTTDNSTIKYVANTYLGTGGCVHILDTVIVDNGSKDAEVGNWIMAKAAAICTREVRWLTDEASNGRFFEEAQSLRVPANSVKLDLLQSFSIPKLLVLYERTTPCLQKFLKTVVGKDSPPPGANESVVRCQRNPDMVRFDSNPSEKEVLINYKIKGRTMITSMMLNLRSRETNLHGAMNSLMLWDGRVPKRLVQTLNRYGFCTSYPYQTKAVGSVSKDLACGPLRRMALRVQSQGVYNTNSSS
ncbi:hypothetical protein C8J57DRAFT_1073673 [Mycena rebaudengoi]|nr:hypothetical protein C8J57DRAFT_1073673 [Mycena rebaudengoi]